MRYSASISAFVAAFVTVLMSGRAHPQTIEELQAQIDSIQAVQKAQAIDSTRVVVDSILKADAPKVDSLGVKVLAHPRDEVWVQIDLPVTTASDPLKAALLKLFYDKMISDYKAKPAGVVWRVNIRQDRAKKALRWLEKHL